MKSKNKPLVVGKTKTCPHCGRLFLCLENDIHQCHCSSVFMTEKKRKKIKQLYEDCLCNECLIMFSKK